MFHAFALFFAICAGTGEHLQDCEDGITRARSCQHAEQHVRAGMTQGQTLHVWRCERVETREARR
jgi:hypothetical protein